VVPVPIVDLCLRRFHFDGPGAHIQQQEQPSVQQLHGEEVHLGVLLTLGVPPVLSFALGEEDEPVGFGGAEVERDRSHSFGVPLGQRQRRLRTLEADGVQSGNVLALKDNVALKFHFGVDDAGQTRQLQADVIVLVHHLDKKQMKT
ncbi:hypothetical protein NQD34_018050, partial [Periophthalmus magnuspinnatus]